MIFLKNFMINIAMENNTHQHYMARALQLAERGLFTTAPNPNVGCVIVRDGDVVGEGWHRRAGESHAEVYALADAGEQARGATCYVTLEPCSHTGRTPPCADALIAAGVAQVFVAMQDPNPKVAGAGIQRLREAGISVEVGLMASEAELLNVGFCKRMRTGRPFVRSKLAMSLDGRTAMASGESQWITGVAARQDVQKLRARSDAIITGIGTVLADDPALTVRPEGDWYPEGEAVRQPLRVVVDSAQRTPKTARLFETDSPVLLASSFMSSDYPKATVMALADESGQVDLDKLLDELAWQDINEVFIEAGAELNGALLAAGLIDEMVIYMAPKLMGDGARGLFHLPALTTMAQNIDLEIQDIRVVGKDWRITARPRLG